MKIPRRLRRFSIVAPVFALVLGVLTFVEQRRLAETLPASPAPASTVRASPGPASPGPVSPGPASPAAASPPTTAAAGAPRIDAVPLMADVKALASPQLEGRLTGSPGGARARAMIVERFKTIGVTELSALPGYLQPFTFTHTSVKALWRKDRPFRKHFAGTNIVGLIPPRAGSGTTDATPALSAAARRYIVLSAHYDHLGVRNGQVYPGADDNASGVAALLGIAAYLRQHPLSRGVIIAAFDGEEEGLRGASAFVDHPAIPLEAIDVMVNMDMISRSATSDITIAGPYHWPALTPIVSRAASSSPVHVHFGHDHPFWRSGLVEDWTHASDQGPFHDAGVPFLYVGVEDHQDYHQVTDTADRIEPRFYVATTELVLQLLEEIDRDPAARYRRPAR